MNVPRAARRRTFIVFGLPKPSSKVLNKFYFHCIFVIYLILFYVNDSVGLMKKSYFSRTSILCDRYSGFPSLHRKVNKVLQGGRALAFYRITPCLSGILIQVNIRVFK